jgi:5-methylcytosine-specific restriction endonuclease McrA
MSNPIDIPFDLPADIRCPATGGILVKEGDKPIMKFRHKRGSETKRCFSCRRRHCLKDFKTEENMKFYEFIDSENTRIRTGVRDGSIEVKYNDEVSSSQGEDYQELNAEEIFEEVVEDSDLEDYKDKLLFNLKRLNCLNNEIASDYQTIVSKSPRRPKNSKREVDFSSNVKRLIWKRNFFDLNKFACPVCSIAEISIDNYVVGHIHPFVRDGSDNIDNLLPICGTCNSSMNDQHLYFYAWNRYGNALWKHQS